MRTIIMRILSGFGMVAIMIVMAACPDGIHVQKQQEKTVVNFTITNDTVRTVLPPHIAPEDIVRYKLSGTRDDIFWSELSEFSGDTTHVSIELIHGTWDFTLDGYNENNEIILQGNVYDVSIVLGTTTQVYFSLSVINNGMGNIRISFNFPEATAITRIITCSTIASEDFDDIYNGNFNGNFDYVKNNIAAGDYLINFGFYHGDILRTTITELVLVRNNLTSSKTIILTGEDLKRVLSGTVTVSPHTIVVIGTELTAAYSGTENVSWQWNKDGVPVPGATASDYTPDETGEYTVTVSVATYDSKTSTAVAVVGHPVEVTGDTLSEQLTSLASSAESFGNYVIEVTADESISAFNLSYIGRSNIVITLKADMPQTISFTSPYLNVAMFTINTGVTLILENNITLSRGNGTSINIIGGLFIMNSGSALFAGRIRVFSNGTFIMNGGTISDNTSYEILTPTSTPYLN